MEIGDENLSASKKSPITIIIGHNQPHIQFQDAMKAKYSEPVWVRGYIINALTKNKIDHKKRHSKHHAGVYRERTSAANPFPMRCRNHRIGVLSGSGMHLIIMPAFNELCGATTVNKDALLGPIAKNLDYKKTHIFLLDGTDLGKLSDL